MQTNDHDDEFFQDVLFTRLSPKHLGWFWVGIVAAGMVVGTTGLVLWLMLVGG